jgi:hypothetical protein
MSWRLVFAVVAVCACKERDAAPPAPGGSATVAGSGAGGSPTPTRTTRTGEGPALPAPPDAGPAIDAPSARAQFDAEPRDEAWAAATEQAIAERLTRLAPRVECRSAQCRVTVTAANQPGISRLIDALEAPTGLRGLASSMLIDVVGSRPDGTHELVVYARIRGTL